MHPKLLFVNHEIAFAVEIVDCTNTIHHLSNFVFCECGGNRDGTFTDNFKTYKTHPAGSTKSMVTFWRTHTCKHDTDAQILQT